MFPDSDAAFNIALNIRVPYLNTNSARLTITAPRMTRATAALVRWNGSYPTAVATDSDANIIQKNLDRTELEASVRDIMVNIPEGLFIVADRTTLNHPLRDAEPTAVDVKAYAPTIVLDKNTHGLSTFRLTDPAHPETQSMPEGQKVLLIWFTGATRAVPAPSAMTFQDVEVVSKFLKNIKYDDSMTGQWAYLKVCYVNNRGAKGPWSDFISVLIN